MSNYFNLYQFHSVVLSLFFTVLIRLNRIVSHIDVYFYKIGNKKGKGNKYIVNKLIMKKYEKVNLTASIYKQKTPTKSPINIKPVQSSQHNSFNKNYQNVCCPNCRYLFKISKENQRPKTPTNISKMQTGSKGGLVKNQRTIEVQTEQYLLGNFRTSPKRQRLRQQSANRGKMTDRTPERLPYFQEIKNRNKSPMHTDRNDIAKGQLLTSRKKQSSHLSNQKISNLIKDKSSTKQKFPARSAYMKSNAQTSKIKQEKSTHSLQKQNQKKPNPTVNFEELNNNLVGELMKKIQLSEEINEIIKYQMNLPPELSVPSYCKMLMYDMEDRREAIKQKQKGVNGHQKLEHSIYEEELSNERKVDREIKRMLHY